MFNNVINPNFTEIELEQVQTVALVPTLVLHRSMLRCVSLVSISHALGVFHRLFTLFKDECHQLDLQLAELTNPQAGDRSAYCSHSKTVHEERKLLDGRDLLEDEIKRLEHTTSYLTLNSTNPSTDPTL